MLGTHSKLCSGQMSHICDISPLRVNEENEMSKNFPKNIRKFNSTFSFASIGAQTVQNPVVAPIATRYMVRHITPLALYTHLMIKNECMVNYIIEGDQAVVTRMSATPNSECLPEVMEIIQRVMSEISPYADAYRHMHSIEQAEERSTETVNREPQEVRLFFERGPDCRRYMSQHMMR